jgi:anti-anti-sigma factor
MRACGAGSPGRSHFRAELVPGSSPPLLVICGEIDPLTRQAFGSAVDRALELHRRLYLDLRGITFMDSTGLNVLIATFHRLGQVPDAVVLVEPSLPVRRLLEVAGVDGLFPIRETSWRSDRRPPLARGGSG